MTRPSLIRTVDCDSTPRVLHIINALGRGGAEVLLTQGLAVADRRRFEYSFGHFLSHPQDIAEDLRSQGATVHCFGAANHAGGLLSVRRLARLLSDQHIDVVHAHLTMAGVVARLAGRLARVPVVYTEHAPIESYHPLARRLSLMTWQWQHQVIAISDDVATSIRQHAGERVPVTTVWNGVNTSAFTPSCCCSIEVRSALEVPLESPVVGTVASFRDTPQKRLDLWLNAAKLIHAAEPTTHFLLVGDGPLRGKLEHQARTLGIAGAVRFVGRQSDVRPFLAAMDVFLMSSAYEGFGIAPVEAMAMETTVVATDVEGVRNVVSPGVTGLLGAFDHNVAATLAGLVVRLIRDPELRRQLAVAGRRSAVEKFSIHRMQRELEGIYERVITEHRSDRIPSSRTPRLKV